MSSAHAVLRFPLLLGATLLAGCGGLATAYADHGPKNLILAPSRTSSSFFVSRRVRLDIYRGTKTGQATYLGTVHVAGTAHDVGLPEGQPLLLDLAFQENPLVGARVVSAQCVPLTIRPGERYRLVTEYVDKGFDYRLERVR